MKTFILLISLCAAAFAHAQMYVGVRLFDMYKVEKALVMTTEELRELQSDLNEEKRVFNKAVQTVKKDWTKQYNEARKAGDARSRFSASPPRRRPMSGSPSSRPASTLTTPPSPPPSRRPPSPVPPPPSPATRAVTTARPAAKPKRPSCRRRSRKSSAKRWSFR